MKGLWSWKRKWLRWSSILVECAELIEIREDTHEEEVKNSPVQAFEIAGVNFEKRDFHAIHRFRKSKIVIAKAEILKFYETKRNYVNFLAVENKSL